MRSNKDAQGGGGLTARQADIIICDSEECISGFALNLLTGDQGRTREPYVTESTTEHITHLQLQLWRAKDSNNAGPAILNATEQNRYCGPQDLIRFWADSTYVIPQPDTDIEEKPDWVKVHAVCSFI